MHRHTIDCKRGGRFADARCGPNDEVERRGGAPTANEADLSQSSTPSLAHRKCDSRSLEPIVRQPTSAVGLVLAQNRLLPPTLIWPRRSIHRCSDSERTS